MIVAGVVIGQSAAAFAAAVLAAADVELELEAAAAEFSVFESPFDGAGESKEEETRGDVGAAVSDAVASLDASFCWKQLIEATFYNKRRNALVSAMLPSVAMSQHHLHL